MKINTGTLISLATTGILAVALIAGCADKGTASEVDSDKTSIETAGENHSDEPEVEAKLVEFRNDDGELVCPVMGVVVGSTEEEFGFQDYEGTRYYFCCNMCPDSFEADPEKYVVKGVRDPAIGTGS